MLTFRAVRAALRHNPMARLPSVSLPSSGACLCRRLLHGGRSDGGENDAAGGAGGQMRLGPTRLPSASRQIELARAVRRKLTECGAEALGAITLNGWDEFFARTGLDEYTRAPEDEAQVTLILSYPLTMAWLMQEQQCAATKAPTDSKTRISPSSLPSLAPTSPSTSAIRKIHIIGARAEVSLPEWVWLLVANLNGIDSLKVDLIGPMVPEREPSRKHGPVRLYFTGHSLYHDAVFKDQIDPADADAFFCFHPGWGQREWKNSWQPTLDLLFAADAPVHFTSFDDDDLGDDCAFARQQLNCAKDGVGDEDKKSLWSGENPFRSKVFIKLNDRDADNVQRLIAVNSRVSMVAPSAKRVE